MPFPDLVNGGVNDELKHERREDAADHRRGDPLHDVGTYTGGPHDGHEPHEHHRHGHELRANPLYGTVHDGVAKVTGGSQASFTAGVFICNVEIEQHEDAGLRVDAHQCDQADPDADAHVVAEQIEQPHSADGGERHGQEDDEGLRHRPRVHVEE